MKKRVLNLLLIAVVILVNQTVVKAAEPQEMGKHTVKLLKTINDWNNETYDKYMISIEDIYQSLNKGKDTSQKISDKAKEGWLKEMNKRFLRVKEDGSELGINWSKIKYLDFTYKDKEEGSTKIYDGKLYFSYKKKAYRIEVGFLITDKGLRLGNLEDLMEETEKKF